MIKKENTVKKTPQPARSSNTKGKSTPKRQSADDVSSEGLLLRQAALALADILNNRGPADAVLSHFFRENRQLGSKDRAFVAETVFGILRRYRVMQYLTQSDDPRQWVLAWLLRGEGKSIRELEPMLNAQQLEWAKAIKARSTESLTLAEQANLPDWLWEKLVAQNGETVALDMARSLMEPATLDLRVNTLKAEPEAVMAVFKQEATVGEHGLTRMPFAPSGLRIPQRLSISKHPLFTEGKIEVQDEGSQLLAQLVAPKRGMMVADFCAGAGGKSLAIGALMRNTGRIYAFDVSEKRLNNLGQRLKRSGLSNLNAQLISSEADPKLKRLHGKFDRVLVDAPCSGLGTLRRNPDIKRRQTPTDIAELTQKQASILERAAKLCKAGGRLIYATCSLLQDENEQIADAFLQAHPDFQRVPANSIMAQQNIALDTGDYLKLWPHVHGTDGFFAAVFERIA